MQQEIKNLLGVGVTRNYDNILDYLPLWVEEKNKVSATFENEFGTKCKVGKNVSYLKVEGKY